jgi:hypothetical protein
MMTRGAAFVLSRRIRHWGGGLHGAPLKWPRCDHIQDAGTA